MTAPFIGEIRMFGFNFPPRNWAYCNGQLLSIAQNTALFSILGTTYGGNGTTNFALPDLRGHATMHQGTGPGLTPRVLGESGGTETVTLLQTELPSHTHALQGTSAPGSRAAPVGAVPAASRYNTTVYQTNTSANLQLLSPTTIGVAGGSQAHNNMQPYLAVNFVIALRGVFPSRN